MSKADRIRKLLHLPNDVIAERLGHTRQHPGGGGDDLMLAYIRVVRQRTSRFGNPIETAAGIRWKENNPDAVRRMWRAQGARKRARRKAA